jgi:nucleotide-binding universal stress UspA family protein
MNTPILVPLDGSTFAEQALPTAIDLAARTGRRLQLVRVHVPRSSPTDVPGDARWDALVHEEGEDYLRGIADRCQREAGLVVRTELLDGTIATALATYVQERGIGLVVMTTHGHGGISRAWVGSVADALVRRVRVPVLLLRPCDRCSPLLVAPRAHHVLIPVDGSELSARILEPAFQLGGLWGAHFTLLHVLPPERPGSRAVDGPDDPRSFAELVLDELAAPLRARGATIDIAVVEGSVPANTILDFAASNAVDAIAIATRGRGGWERVAIGSVADKVMRGSMLPMLLFRPPSLVPQEGDVLPVAPAPTLLQRAG